MDFARFDALTFDCYGTLIDWETGIADALRVAGASGSDDELLAGALRGVGADLGFEPTDEQVAAFAGSVGDWPAFPDSAEALAALKGRFRLGVITNCDDDLFALSNRRLGVDFDWVITAEQARGYKPRRETFELAFERIDVPRERIL